MSITEVQPAGTNDLIGFLLKKVPRKAPPTGVRDDLQYSLNFVAISDESIQKTRSRDKGAFQDLALLGPVLDEFYRDNVTWNMYDRRSVLGVVMGPLNMFLAGRNVFDDNPTNEKFLTQVLDDVVQRRHGIANGAGVLADLVHGLYDRFEQAWARPASMRPFPVWAGFNYARSRPWQRSLVQALVSNSANPLIADLIDQMGAYESQFYVLEFVQHIAPEKGTVLRLRESVIDKAVGFFQMQFDDASKVSPADVRQVATALYIAHIEVPQLMLNTSYTAGGGGTAADPRLRAFGCHLTNSEAIANMILIFASQRKADFSDIQGDPLSLNSGVWHLEDPRVVIQDSVFDRLMHQITWPFVRQVADIIEAGWYGKALAFAPTGFPANSGIQYAASASDQDRSLAVSAHRALRPLIFGIWRRFYSSYPSGEKVRQMINQVAQARGQTFTATQDTVKLFFPTEIFPQFITERIYSGIIGATIPDDPLDTAPDKVPQEIEISESGTGEPPVQTPPVKLSKSAKKRQKQQQQQKKKKAVLIPEPQEEEKPEEKEQEEAEKEEEEKEGEVEEEKSKEKSEQDFSFLFHTNNSQASSIITGTEPEKFLLNALRPLYNEIPVITDEALAIGLRFVLGIGISSIVDDYIDLTLPSELNFKLARVIAKDIAKPGLDVGFGQEPDYPSDQPKLQITVARTDEGKLSLEMAYGRYKPSFDLMKPLTKIEDGKNNVFDSSFRLFYILVCIFSKIASEDASLDAQSSSDINADKAAAKAKKITAVVTGATKTSTTWMIEFDHLIPKRVFDGGKLVQVQARHIIPVLRSAIVSACVRAASIGANERYHALILRPKYQQELSRAVQEKDQLIRQK